MGVETSNHGRRTICLDFDDTLCARDGSMIPGAREAVATMRSWGFRTVVSSARFAPLYGDLNGPRMRRVAEWLVDARIEVDDVVFVVPAAESYIDDRGRRFDGEWDALFRAVGLERERGSRPRRISVDLTCLLPGGEPTEAVRDAVALCEAAGVELVASAGPFVDERDVEASLAVVRASFAAHGLKPVRVEAAKISAEVYAGPRMLRFDGSWPQAVDALAVDLAA